MYQYMILILLTERYLLTSTKSCMLFPHLSFLFMLAVCCLINEYDDDDDKYWKHDY